MWFFRTRNRLKIYVCLYMISYLTGYYQQLNNNIEYIYKFEQEQLCEVIESYEVFTTGEIRSNIRSVLNRKILAEFIDTSLILDIHTIIEQHEWIDHKTRKRLCRIIQKANGPPFEGNLI